MKRSISSSGLAAMTLLSLAFASANQRDQHSTPHRIPRATIFTGLRQKPSLPSKIDFDDEAATITRPLKKLKTSTVVHQESRGGVESSTEKPVLRAKHSHSTGETDCCSIVQDWRMTWSESDS